MPVPKKSSTKTAKSSGKKAVPAKKTAKKSPPKPSPAAAACPPGQPLASNKRRTTKAVVKVFNPNIGKGVFTVDDGDMTVDFAEFGYEGYSQFSPGQVVDIEFDPATNKATAVKA